MKKSVDFIVLIGVVLCVLTPLKLNAHSNIADRISPNELIEEKTPEAVAYNFVQAILNKDFEKMLGYTHPEVALYLILNAESAGCDLTAYMDTLANLIYPEPDIFKRGNEIVVLKAHDEWGYIRDNWEFIEEIEEGVEMAEEAIMPYDIGFVEEDFAPIEPSNASDDDDLGGEVGAFEGVYMVEEAITPSDIGFVEEVMELEEVVAEDDDLEFQVPCPELQALWDNYSQILSVEGKIPTLTVSMNQVVENGMIYVPEDDETYTGINFCRIWFGIIPSSQLGLSSREELRLQEKFAFKIGLIRDSHGHWKVDSIKSYN